MSEGRKRSPWFTSRQPDFPGVYERDYRLPGESGPECPLFCYWSGVFWGTGHEFPGKAYASRKVPSASQDLPWRGLAEKPE